MHFTIILLTTAARLFILFIYELLVNECNFLCFHHGRASRRSCLVLTFLSTIFLWQFGLLPVAMQHMARRILYLSTAGAFSYYMVHNRTKKSTVFATPISDADIKTTRFQKPDSDTEIVTFSLIEDTHEEPSSNGLELRNVQIFFRHGARTPLTKLQGLPEVILIAFSSR